MLDRHEGWLNWALVALVLLVWTEALWNVRWLPWTPGRLEAHRPVLDRVEAEVKSAFSPGDRILALNGRPVVPGLWEHVFKTTSPGGSVRVRYLHQETERDVDVTVQPKLRGPELPWWGWAIVAVLAPMLIGMILIGLLLDACRSETRTRRVAVRVIVAGFPIAWAATLTAWPAAPHDWLRFALWIPLLRPALVLYAFPVENRWGRWTMWLSSTVWAGVYFAENAFGYLPLSGVGAMGIELLLLPVERGLLLLMLFKMQPEGPKAKLDPAVAT